VVLENDEEDKVLHSQKGEKYPTTIKRRKATWIDHIFQRKANWIDHILYRNCLLKHIIEGKTE
jgi:hypothetical protein